MNKCSICGVEQNSFLIVFKEPDVAFHAKNIEGTITEKSTYLCSRHCAVIWILPDILATLPRGRFRDNWMRNMFEHIARKKEEVSENANNRD